jgi:KDO2-lipid IV(A) lauroyltransferase
MIPWLAYRSADIVTQLLPATWVHGLARGIGAVAFTLPLPARRTLERNLRAALPELDDREAQQCAREAYRHFAMTLVDFLRLRHLSGEAIERAIRLEGVEHLDRAIAARRGAIVLSAHLGNWEWGAAILARRGIRVHAMMRPHSDARVEALFARTRNEWGVSVLPRNTVWAAAQVLRNNGCVALMGDRGLRGRTTSVCAWAALLARRTGAAIIPGVMVRTAPGKYTARFEAPLSPEACRNGAFRDALRRHVARHSEQWLAFEPLPDGVA